MAVLKFTNSKSSLKKLAQYITSDEKTEEMLISGKDCMPTSAYDEMITVKQMFGKRSGRQYIHLVQSFDVSDQVSYQKAHEVGRALAELFTGFQILLTTHKDRRHVHNHLLINSVNFETGFKYQQSKEDMQNIKNMSDYLCREAGLSVIEHKGGDYISRAEYKAAEKGESWKFRLINMIDNSMAVAKTKDEFILFMELHGYGVKWTDSRSNITYTTPDGFKCRDDKLHDKKYTKEEMENGFIHDEHIQSSEPAEKEASEAEGAFQEITLQMEGSMKEMRDLTMEIRKTLDSSVTVLQGINLLLVQIKTLTENANRLYAQMIGADKAGIKKLRKTFIKGILIGILAGMAAWLVIAVVLK